MTMSNCLQCQQKLTQQRLWLNRRIEVMSFTGDNIHVTVLASDGGIAFCGLGCWIQHEQEIINQLQLKTCYPELAAISGCCRCGGPLDRRQAYVVYTLLDVTLESKPWLKSCAVHSDEEFAVLCQQCEFPKFEESTVEEDVPETSSEFQKLLADLERMA